MPGAGEPENPPMGLGEIGETLDKELEQYTVGDSTVIGKLSIMDL